MIPNPTLRIGHDVPINCEFRFGLSCTRRVVSIVSVALLRLKFWRTASKANATTTAATMATLQPATVTWLASTAHTAAPAVLPKAMSSAKKRSLRKNSMTRLVTASIVDFRTSLAAVSDILLLGKGDRHSALPFSLRDGTHYDFNIATEKRQAIHQLALREAAKMPS